MLQASSQEHTRPREINNPRRYKAGPFCWHHLLGCMGIITPCTTAETLLEGLTPVCRANVCAINMLTSGEELQNDLYSIKLVLE